ncbi:hypothetical protein ACFQJC_14515 [Haloferax namakaokahaiae]|uniref:Metallothionein n=1 Tax=Haloferax namakaokahaiae TaxID=1748331 RepID=A0ABD5ZII0_9EURY
MSDPLDSAELLTEDDIMTGYEGETLHCPNPECYCTPSFEQVIKHGQCYCGEGMSVYIVRERDRDE